MLSDQWEPAPTAPSTSRPIGGTEGERRARARTPLSVHSTGKHGVSGRGGTAVTNSTVMSGPLTLLGRGGACLRVQYGGAAVCSGVRG